MDKKESTKPPKKLHWRVLKWFFIILVILLLILVLTIFSLNQYLKSDERKVFEDVSFLNQGTLSFDQAHISVFEDFPKASIVFKNLIITDSTHTPDLAPFIQVERLSGNLSLKDWRNRIVEVKEFQLSHGALVMKMDADGNSNWQSLLPSGNNSSTESDIDKPVFHFGVNTEHVNVNLEDVAILIVNAQDGMDLKGKARKLNSNLHLMPDAINGNVDMDFHIEGLIFDESSGTYLNDSQVKGAFELSIAEGIAHIDPFNLQINNEVFKFEGEVALDGVSHTTLHLENQKTRLDKVLPLLPMGIQQDVEPYKINEPFVTNSSIQIKPGSPVRVDIDFELINNSLVIDGVPFTESNMSGRFVNSLYDDERIKTESTGNVRLHIRDVATRHDSFKIRSNRIDVLSGPTINPTLYTNAVVSGPAAAISEWYNSDRFIFEEGSFQLEGNVVGPLNNIKQIIEKSTATLSLRDATIFYPPADVRIPIVALDLQKESGEATFKMITSTKDPEQEYSLEGGLQNFPSLLRDNSTEAAVSNVVMNADEIDWVDFIALFGDNPNVHLQGIQDEKGTKKSMKQTFRGIYNKVHPSLSLNIDTFHYYDIVDLFNIETSIAFDSENVIRLEEAKFDLKQGGVAIQVVLDIQDPYETGFEIDLQATDLDLQTILPAFSFFNIDLLTDHVQLPDRFNLDIDLEGQIDDVNGLLPNQYEGKISFGSDDEDALAGVILLQPIGEGEDRVIRTSVDLVGSPFLFNDFFDTEDFIFQDSGRFFMRFDFEKAIPSFDHLLDEAIIDLTIVDGAVLYKDLDIVFQLDDLEAQLNKDTAVYRLFMDSDILGRQLNISGDINNVSELLYGNTGKHLSTVVNVYSPIINLSHALNIFETAPDTSLTEAEPVTIIGGEHVDQKMKDLISTLLKRFDPHLQVNLDTFVVGPGIQLTNLFTGMRLVDSTDLVLDETQFDIYNGKVDLSGEINLSEFNREPFKAKVRTYKLDLGYLLPQLDFFKSSVLRSAKNIDGDLSLILDMQGTLEDLKLLEDETVAEVDFDIKNLEVEGLELLDGLARKLFFKKMFTDLKFGPISNHLSIKGSRIEIPQMEVQSSSIDFFVEGYIDGLDHTNVWLSVPLDNLKELGHDVIPEKRGYAATKRKVYIELSNSEEGKVESYFRRSKKKFYEQRGIPEQFKIDKERDNEIRKRKKAIYKNR